MFRSDGNRMRHESLGISRNAIVVESRVGAFEKTRFKRVKLDSILGGGGDPRNSESESTTKDKKLLTEILNRRN